MRRNNHRPVLKTSMRWCQARSSRIHTCGLIETLNVSVEIARPKGCYLMKLVSKDDCLGALRRDNSKIGDRRTYELQSPPWEGAFWWLNSDLLIDFVLQWVGVLIINSVPRKFVNLPMNNPYRGKDRGTGTMCPLTSHWSMTWYPPRIILWSLRSSFIE